MKFNFMKKNQIIVAVIGLMLIAAGYLNFSNAEKNNNFLNNESKLMDAVDMAEIGDAKLVSSEPAGDSKLEQEQSSISTNISASNGENEEADKVNDEKNNKNETEKLNKEEIQTNAGTSVDEYFAKSRLERDTMYSQMIESYQKILDKTDITESQKQTAQKEITNINEKKNAIMITENLIKTKGFEDLIIFINDKSINVIVKAQKLDAKQVAQIQNIITRELKADVENIHISNKNS